MSQAEDVARKRMRVAFVGSLLLSPLVASAVLLGFAVFQAGPDLWPPVQLVGTWIWDGVSSGHESGDRVLQIVLGSLGIATGLFAVHAFSRAGATGSAGAVYGDWVRGIVTTIYLASSTTGWLLVIVCGIDPEGQWWASAAGIMLALICAAYLVVVWNTPDVYSRRLVDVQLQLSRLRAASVKESARPRFAGYGPAVAAGLLTVIVDLALMALVGPSGWGVGVVLVLAAVGIGGGGAMLLNGRATGRVAGERYGSPARGQAAPVLAHVVSASVILYATLIQGSVLGWFGLVVGVLQGAGLYGCRRFRSDEYLVEQIRQAAIRGLAKEEKDLVLLQQADREDNDLR